MLVHAWASVNLCIRANLRVSMRVSMAVSLKTNMQIHKMIMRVRTKHPRWKSSVSASNFAALFPATEVGACLFCPALTARASDGENSQSQLSSMYKKRRAKEEQEYLRPVTYIFVSSLSGGQLGVPASPKEGRRCVICCTCGQDCMNSKHYPALNLL